MPSLLNVPKPMARLLTCTVLILPFSSMASADVLIDNIEGISINREGQVDRFAAMVVGDDGRITHLLDFGDDPPEEVSYHEDGKGRVVIPGIVDAHGHVMSLGLGQLTLDLSSTRSLEEALSRIAAYAAAHPDRPWLLGRGWNEEKWGLDRLPSAKDLSVITDGRPIWMERVDGHAGWANDAALKAAKITSSTQNPDGGRIIRTPGSKIAQGVLIDNAKALIEAVIPPPLPEDRDLALHEAQQLLISHGVTAIADMGTDLEDWMSFRRAGDAGRLRIRIMSYASSIDTMLLIGGTGPTPWLYDDRLRLNGVKLIADGTLGSHGAGLKSEYADDPGNMGLELLNGTQLRNIMSRAALDNFQVAVHAVGDAANYDALSAIDEMAGDYSGDRRWRIEHAQVLDPADIAIFGRHGIIASMQPAHQTSGRLMSETRLGPDRLLGAYAWRSIAATGAPLAFGSDVPAEAPDVFAGMAAATSRTDVQGEPFGGWLPLETISREAALAAYTATAAYAGFADGHFGRLVVGEMADFIMISADPLLASPESMREIQVLETWIAGQKVYKKP